ncbi:transcriptional regulator with XRE-family HTH domain [Saccharothrix coeruleofusca]|uniref:helix-turn-helix domain-containing protein n=1 Tax=Saccharothrix coeruleofusca TaxID=33919 RepID=UPI001AEADB86|nr:helix-turn-helix transcriptional regulator [Saccharothrix coeruleofusca]MBP2336231.1 transcriptional regulator with XRE-family HTH domain [Saccharothrix coeruleofusca]
MVSSSPKAVALGAQLRAVREAKDIGLRELARQLGVDHSVLSRIESGQRSPTPRQVAAHLTSLGISGVERDRLVEMARSMAGSSWLALTLPDRQAQLAALLQFEQMASRIVTVEPLLVPGLLQTSAYARAIMCTGNEVPVNEVEVRVVARIGRREILTREDDPVRFTAFIGMAVLRHIIGSPAVMVEQLRYLMKVAERPNVTLRVIPDEAGWYHGLEGAFVILDIQDSTRMVYIENQRSGLFLRDKRDIAAYAESVEAVRALALDPTRTVEVIAGEAERIKGSA